MTSSQRLLGGRNPAKNGKIGSFSKIAISYVELGVGYKWVYFTFFDWACQTKFFWLP